MILDDLRNYLQMASGLTEATTTKARDVVTGLVAQGLQLSAKAVPAPEMMSQVQELADDLVATSRNNREMLLGMIRSEVDRAVGRMGFVREDELEALRRHVQRLEKQVSDLDAAVKAPAPAASPAPHTAHAPRATHTAHSTHASHDTAPAETPAPEAPEAPSSEPENTDAPPARKKKVIVVDPEATS